MYLRGFDRRGCAASLNNASASGFTVSGVFSDQADFAVLVLFDADDQFGHLFTTKYLPDFSLAGVTLAKTEAAIKTEQSKVNALRNAAARWSRAQQIRAFICAATDAAVQNGQPIEPGSPFGEWILWAERQADRLDPLKESPPSIIDQKPRAENTGYYGYGYQKPDPPFRFPKPIWRMKS
jgi:hypothetical protein